MPTSRLKLTASELLKLVNLTGEAHLFSVGNAEGEISESDLVDLMESEEQSLISMLPEHYADIISGKVTGECLTDKELGAKEGQTELQLSFFPVDPDSLLLFVNFTEGPDGQPYRARTREDALDPSEYTLNAETGGIVLNTGLSLGDKVHADSEHDAGLMFTSIRQLALKLSRLELMFRLPNWNDSTTVLADAREALENQILSYANGGTPKGIREIDKVSFVTETRQEKGKTARVPHLGGYK